MSSRERCTATNRAGDRCGRWPAVGATVCSSHGGKAPQVRRAAARRREEQAAQEAVRALGLPVDVSPTDALLEEVRWTAGHVAWLRGRVQELEEQPGGARHALTWGTSKVTDKRSSENPGIDTVEAAAPSVWYELYERERRHLVAVASAALKAGVEERKVKLAENQGLLVATALKTILAGLLQALLAAGMAAHLETAWQAAVSEIVPRELRRIGGETA